MPKILKMVLVLAALSGMAGYATTVCVSSGNCHVCRLYSSTDGSYEGYVSWGC